MDEHWTEEAQSRGHSLTDLSAVVVNVPPQCLNLTVDEHWTEEAQSRGHSLTDLSGRGECSTSVPKTDSG